MNLLSQAMEAFNTATIELQSSYELLQEEARKLREEVEDKNRKLSDVSNLLKSVIDNTRSAILVLDADGTFILKNAAGTRLINDNGEDFVMEMLALSPSEGVLDYDNGNGMYFRLSVGQLLSDNLNGTVYVIDDITTLKKFEFEKQRGEKLQLMGEMAANIAHEIRNPLGSMELFASLLERDLRNNPDHTRLTSNSVKAIRTINAIISNTLLVTKELKVQKSNYILADIVDDVILYLQHAIREKRVTIVNRLDESDINCDRDLFRQVVVNLVHNAIDAVKEDGTVILESFKDDRELRLVITDNGRGIAADMKPRLFMPFQTTKAKGTGLGLSISYKIIKAHGGDIAAESDGATYTLFSVMMPL
jgi:two-component system sensor histidine kinase FlrB